MDVDFQSSPLYDTTRPKPTNSYELSCGGDGLGNEAIYRITVPNGHQLYIRLTSTPSMNVFNIKHQISYGSGCPGTIVKCGITFQGWPVTFFLKLLSEFSTIDIFLSHPISLQIPLLGIILNKFYL